MKISAEALRAVLTPERQATLASYLIEMRDFYAALVEPVLACDGEMIERLCREGRHIDHSAVQVLSVVIAAISGKSVKEVNALTIEGAQQALACPDVRREDLS